MSQENVEIVRAAIDALNTGDMDAVVKARATGFEPVIFRFVDWPSVLLTERSWHKPIINATPSPRPRSRFHAGATLSGPAGKD